MTIAHVLLQKPLKIKVQSLLKLFCFSEGTCWCIRLYRTAAILGWRHILLTSMGGDACKGQLPAIEETKRSSAIMPNRDHCCVPHCRNNSSKNIPNPTFHQFPSDESIWKQWIVKIRRDVTKSFQVNWLGLRGHCTHVSNILVMIWSTYR